MVKATRLWELTLDKSWSSRLGGLSWGQLPYTGKLLAKKSPTRKCWTDDFRRTKAC